MQLVVACTDSWKGGPGIGLNQRSLRGASEVRGPQLRGESGSKYDRGILRGIY